MSKAMRTRFRCIIIEDGQQSPALCTGIQIIVPSGLTREQAQDFVAGRIAGEVRRYAAAEALGLSQFDNNTDWNEPVT
jgi:hypothetical protein